MSERRRAAGPRRLDDQEVWEMKEQIHEAHQMALAVGSRIDAHERVCAERYKSLDHKVSVNTKILAWAGSGLVGGMFAVIILLVTLVLEK